MIQANLSQSNNSSLTHHSRHVKISHLKARLEPELPYAIIGDSCDPMKFNTIMMPYYNAIVSRNLSLARQVFDSILVQVQSLTGGNQTTYIKDICFGAALTCPTDKKQCDCLSIETHFKFVEDAGTCRAEEGTQCLPYGYKCRDHHICKEYKCTKQNSGHVPAYWDLLNLALLMLYLNVK